MKGIIITALNRPSLGQQYNIDPNDFDDLLPLTYILIADFGGSWFEGVCTQLTFDEFFIKGDAIENEYFIVTRKPAV